MTDLAQLLTVIGSIATPVLILVLTAIGWAIRNRFENLREREEYLRELEEKLREDRIVIYNTVLEPYITLLTPDVVFQNDKSYRNKTKQEVATEKMFSMAYGQNSFKLSLIGSDNVVRAHNALRQHSFNLSAGQTASPEDTKVLFNLLGTFLLEIRRSVGNQKTTLSNLEMLEWLMKDIDMFRN